MSDTDTTPTGFPVKKILLLAGLALAIWYLCKDKTAGPPPVPAG